MYYFQFLHKLPWKLLLIEMLLEQMKVEMHITHLQQKKIFFFSGFINLSLIKTGNDLIFSILLFKLNDVFADISFNSDFKKSLF